MNKQFSSTSIIKEIPFKITMSYHIILVILTYTKILEKGYGEEKNTVKYPLNYPGGSMASKFHRKI